MDSIIIIDTTWKINLGDLQHLDVITQRNNVTLYKSLWRKYQTVCVKRIKVTPKNHKYVQREFDIIKICAHPCVYQFYGACVDSDQDDEYVYFLFEYMEHGNLLEYIHNHELSKDKKRNIVRDIAIGMHYLCSRKPVSIIHRDFKPENILVNKYGDVKIADFGISKQMLNEMDSTNSLTADPMTHSSIGTLRWTAPEIMCPDIRNPSNGTRYTHLCDIYSLGLLIYFIMTEKLPYSDLFNNGAKIAYAKKENIRTFLEDLKNDPLIHDMVQACTEKDYTLRPQSPEDIIKVINIWNC